MILKNFLARQMRRGGRGLVTLGCGVQTELLDITRQSRENYARMHHYTVIEESKILNESRPPAWSRVDLLEHLLASGEYRTLVWIDADASVVDPRQDIASELPETKNLQLVAHRY
jgi:hypothetical protein